MFCDLGTREEYAFEMFGENISSTSNLLKEIIKIYVKYFRKLTQCWFILVNIYIQWRYDEKYI